MVHNNFFFDLNLHLLDDIFSDHIVSTVNLSRRHANERIKVNECTSQDSAMTDIRQEASTTGTGILTYML